MRNGILSRRRLGFACLAGTLLVAGAAAAQGFSCLDTCANTFGNDIIVSGKRYDLSSCSAILHDGHYHVDCNYVG
jgi:hypothetical protein